MQVCIVHNDYGKRSGEEMVVDSPRRPFTDGGRKSRHWFGRIEVRNRHYIVRKHGLSLWRFWLGSCIRSAMTLASGLTRNTQELGRFRGNLSEVAKFLSANLREDWSDKR